MLSYNESLENIVTHSAAKNVKSRMLEAVFVRLSDISNPTRSPYTKA